MLRISPVSASPLIIASLVADGVEIGTMYFDLYPRESKYNHAAHFTVRCGCKFLRDGVLTDQTPIVAIVANFTGGDSQLKLLSHTEAETLFHEFGHALHSIMSRTKVRQTVSFSTSTQYL